MIASADGIVHNVTARTLKKTKPIYKMVVAALFLPRSRKTYPAAANSPVPGRTGLPE
jgi:hypothetical protein